MRRALDVADGVLVLGLLVASVWLWPRLPAEIPAHFGLDGRPDRWVRTTLRSWFLLPVIALFTHVGLLLLRRWMVRRPGRMNLPGGRRVSDYPVELHPAIIEHMRTFMALVSLEILVIFSLIQWGTFQAAVGGTGEGPMIAVLAICALSGPVLIVVYFLGLQRVTRPGGP